MIASAPDRNSDGHTYREWLAQSESPDGFRAWNGSYQHWRLSHPLGWAVSCYLNSKTWRRLQHERFRRIRNSLKKQSVAPAPGS